jgi:hypothetical protein
MNTRRSCPHCGACDVFVSVESFSAVYLFCYVCAATWDEPKSDGGVEPLRPMLAFARGSDRMSLTAENRRQLMIRSAEINEHTTFATPEDLERFVKWFEQFLCSNGWVLVTKGVDRRRTATERVDADATQERPRILPYRKP